MPYFEKLQYCLERLRLVALSLLIGFVHGTFNSTLCVVQTNVHAYDSVKTVM